jgi:hypothetical protein
MEVPSEGRRVSPERVGFVADVPEAPGSRAHQQLGRALREAVVIRKIVGTLRNPKGAEMFARLVTVLGTWKL